MQTTIEATGFFLYSWQKMTDILRKAKPSTRLSVLFPLDFYKHISRVRNPDLSYVSILEV